MYDLANVFNNKYGTLASSTNDLLEKNFDVLFDIDWQGTQQLTQSNNNNIVGYQIRGENTVQKSKTKIGQVFLRLFTWNHPGVL